MGREYVTTWGSPLIVPAPWPPSSVFPDWVLLDRFAFRRDANTSLPETGYRPLRAQGTTSQGVDFGVALCLADPPGTSRLYVLFPSGTDPAIACDLVAAHGNHLLFMITDTVKPGESSLDLMCHQDLFVCRVASPDQSPLLRRLPACTDLLIRGMVGGEEMTMQHLLFPQGVGFLCRDEQVLAVAQLDQIIPISDGGMWEAGLSVLSADGRGDGATWEVNRLPILHPEHEKLDISLWSDDTVISFKNYICWVDYCMGGILFFHVFKGRPDVSYLDLPNHQGRSRHPPGDRGYLRMYRGVSVTDGGRLLKFVRVDRDDGKLVGPSDSGYTITSHSLEITENGGMQWVMVALMRSDQVLPSVRTDYDFNILKLPLVSMEEAHVVHFLYSDSERTNGGYDKVLVVTVDMNAKTLLSTHPYMRGEECFGEDADMYEVKCCNLNSFLAVKLPMCVSRKRKILDNDSY